MIALQVVLLFVGLGLLVYGADWFVDGGAGIAKKCRISPLIIGLTIVAFGTSAPELAVSVTSAIKHSTDISIGNVVGSNIANILLILGVSALVHTLPVQKISLKLDFPVLLIASVLLIALGWGGRALAWYDGLILLVVFSGYMAILFYDAIRKQRGMLRGEELSESKQTEAENVAEGASEAEREEKKNPFARWKERMSEKTWFLILLLLIGLAMVVGGGTLLVNAAKSIAQAAGLSERIIGLTIVAVGTSLPELVTSVVAAAKGETDIEVGKIKRRKIFDIYIVAGVASLVYPLTFTAANLIDAIVALAAAILLYLLSLVRGNKLGKVSGCILLAGFVGYYVWLFLA